MKNALNLGFTVGKCHVLNIRLVGTQSYWRKENFVSEQWKKKKKKWISTENGVLTVSQLSQMVIFLRCRDRETRTAKDFWDFVGRVTNHRRRRRFCISAPNEFLGLNKNNNIIMESKVNDECAEREINCLRTPLTRNRIREYAACTDVLDPYLKISPTRARLINVR